MTKYEAHLRGDFDELFTWLQDGLGQWEREDKSDYHAGGVRCALRVYEKFSLWSRFISLTVLLIESETGLFVSAISSGGAIEGEWARRKLLVRVERIVEAYKQAR